MSVFVQRRTRAAALIREAGLAAVAFVPGPNFAYLTGVYLHLMERPTLLVLCADGSTHALMPTIERQKWHGAMPDVETLYWDDADGPDAAFSALAKRVGEGALGVEGLRMRAAEYRALSLYLGADAVTDGDPALVDLRMTKDASEISDLRRAIAISEAALGETLDAGIAGQRETGISARLMASMLAHGARGFAFEPIVLSGPGSSNPHGDASGRQVGPGDPLLIDFGASFGDMHADITRTVFCDHVRDEHAAIYETVLAANRSGCAAVRAGDAIGDVDDAATSTLEASPFADLIVHKTGHGLGRELHEAPAVMRTNRDVQRAGMVFTVEPGLYRPSDIGIRIEDDVLVTDAGHDCLTQFNREILTFA